MLSSTPILFWLASSFGLSVEGCRQSSTARARASVDDQKGAHHLFHLCRLASWHSDDEVAADAFEIAGRSEIHLRSAPGCVRLSLASACRNQPLNACWRTRLEVHRRLR